jgi:hypothetical protein
MTARIFTAAAAATTSRAAAGFVVPIILLCATTIIAVASERRIRAEVTVHADAGWQQTGVRVHGNGILRFEARGQWVFNPAQPPVDGDGAAELPTTGRVNYVYSGPGGREGQLIGLIGRSRPFVVGAQSYHRVMPNEFGRLYLVINDDIRRMSGEGLKDNRGHLAVTISYVPR